jgi:hypothetical protein
MQSSENLGLVRFTACVGGARSDFLHRCVNSKRLLIGAPSSQECWAERRRRFPMDASNSPNDMRKGLPSSDFGSQRDCDKTRAKGHYAAAAFRIGFM